MNPGQVCYVFHALSDETRLRVARLLIGSGMEVTPGQLSWVLEIAPSHLSRHLQVLENASLISYARAGKTKRAKISRAEGYLDALYAAVAAIPDEQGLFARDMERLVSLDNLNL
jgi:DNA-binding transcriptional ArsR family regulator